MEEREDLGETLASLWNEAEIRRDIFAAAALVGILSNPSYEFEGRIAIAKEAFKVADAMIEEGAE